MADEPAPPQSSLANTIVWAKKSKPDGNLENSMEKGPKTDVEKFVHKAMHIWSQKHPELAEQVLAADVHEHAWGVQGIKEIQEICHAMHDAFEDYHLEVLDVLAQGTLADGKIACRFRAYGKWVRAYCGVEPNNQVIQFPGSLIWIVKDNLVTDSWIYQSYADAPELGYAVLKLSKENQVFC